MAARRATVVSEPPAEAFVAEPMVTRRARSGARKGPNNSGNAVRSAGYVLESMLVASDTVVAKGNRDGAKKLSNESSRAGTRDGSKARRREPRAEMSVDRRRVAACATFASAQRNEAREGGTLSMKAADSVAPKVLASKSMERSAALEVGPSTKAGAAGAALL
jgi:hypothetical protein